MDDGLGLGLRTEFHSDWTSMDYRLGRLLGPKSDDDWIVMDDRMDDRLGRRSLASADKNKEWRNGCQSRI